jgi:hypothetical protein
MTSMHPTEPSGHGTGGHEERDVAYRPVLTGLLGILALLVLSAVLMKVLFGYLLTGTAGAPPSPLAPRFGRQVPPEPRLQSDPLRDLAQLHAEEDAVLQSYAWVDRPAGIVRIPIARAMELLAQSGLPARTDGEQQR